MPIYYREKREFEIVSKSEIQKYLNASDDKEFNILLSLAWLTGARIQELVNLQRKDFEEKYVMEEGRELHLLIVQIKALKWGKTGFPTFDIERDPFVKEVWEYVKNFKEEERIFKRTKRRYQQILKKLNEIVYPNEKNRWLTFHYLRHSRITFLTRKLGATPEEVKSWTGHKSSAFEEYFQHRRVVRFAGKIS